MQENRQQKAMQVSEYANSLIADMKSLSNALKPLSKNVYENNNRILNELLVAKQQQIYSIITKVLSHALQIAQYKPLLPHVLSLLNKTIICLKTLKVQPNPNPPNQLQPILSHIMDVLVAISTQHRDTQDISLRVLQTAFSLIDHGLVGAFGVTVVTRMFSICFQFCVGGSIVQNISVSALFALVEALFQFGRVGDSFQVLQALLQYLFEGKKFLWVKGKDVRGLVWDLVVICIKNFTANHIIGLEHQPQCQKLLQKMYNLILQTIFLKKQKSFYNPIPQTQKPQKSANPSSTSTSTSTSSSSPITSTSTCTDITDFIRFFKAYVALSSSLSLQSYKLLQKQYVGFRTTIPKLAVVCDLERNSRMFVFLEAICQLLLDQYDMPLSLQKGAIFMEILSKVSEELCWCNQTGIAINWDNNESFLHKVVNEEPKINDGDFVRLIKNTLIQLRVKFEKDQDLISSKKKGVEKQSARSVVLPENLGTSKKWEVFIKNVVRIVRYLSSLNFITEQTEQDPTRKIILELQYWFLICPVSKAKNMVLQELLITSNVLNNKMQAVKVSQSVQIGSNILYGYYDDLDSMGLTIILKMMAGIKADWEEGKSFEELDQVYNLVTLIYTQQKLIKNQQSFIMTIQALVQCTSSLIADIEQPKQKQPNSLNSQNSIKRSFKMIDFLLQKLIVVINSYLAEAALQWNFITGFLITLCINKNPKIKEQGIKCIGILANKLLKTQLGGQLDQKKQTDILGLYQQLSKSKLQSKQLQLSLIDQLKTIMPRIKQQGALMDGFRIVKILSDSQAKNGEVIGSIHQLQEILIKDCLFRITEIKYLRLIVDGMQIKVAEKNQEYRLINLLWSTADYFRKITPTKNIPNQYIELWEALFKSIWVICESSRECQTKQSAIHSTTQILAQILSILPFDFIIVIIQKYYHQMVLLLLGIHPSSLADSEKSSETAKVALKNYIKIFKKLISITEQSQEDKKEIGKNFATINQSITKFIRSHVQKRTTGGITLQLLYELSNFILAVKDDKGFEEYGIKSDLRQMFSSIEELVKLTEQLGVANPKMDLKSHMYKKKLKPLLDKLREAQDTQKKQQMFANPKPEGGE